jgi:hypothetical protein
MTTKKGNERPSRDDDMKEGEMPAGHMKDETAAREGEILNRVFFFHGLS